MDKTFKIKPCAVRLNRVNLTLLQQIGQELHQTPRIRNCAVRLHRCYLPANSTNGHGHHAQRNGSIEKSVTPILPAEE